MGIFSLFGKRGGPAPAPSERARTAERPPAPAAHVMQRQAAQATSLKIDAIEFEMSSEFVSAVLPRTRKPIPAGAPAPTKASAASVGKLARRNTTLSALTFGPTVMGPNTAFLMDTDSLARTIALSSSETAPAIDEAAILFALGELGLVEELLQKAIQDPALGQDTRIAWAMLLDLYQIMNQREQFDELSIAYANQFETSPPAWLEQFKRPTPKGPAGADALPSIVFTGKLDSSILPQLEQLQNLASSKHTVRLEFTHVTEVNPIGCGVLLRVLKKLQMPGHDLVLVGALELTEKIRSILKVGRRDETAAPWLLLLEILRLLNMEQAFEDSSIEYCITFEVSPPAFVAPHNKVTSVAPEVPDNTDTIEQFVLPAEIAEHSEPLMLAIAQYVSEHNPAVLNCSALIRVDFNAASQLMTHLEPLVSHGIAVKMQDVNHLVAALFRIAGMHEILHMQTRKI